MTLDDLEYEADQIIRRRQQREELAGEGAFIHLIPAEPDHECRVPMWHDTKRLLRDGTVWQCHCGRRYVLQWSSWSRVRGPMPIWFAALYGRFPNLMIGAGVLIVVAAVVLVLYALTLVQEAKTAEAMRVLTEEAT